MLRQCVKLWRQYVALCPAPPPPDPPSLAEVAIYHRPYASFYSFLYTESLLNGSERQCRMTVPPPPTTLPCLQVTHVPGHIRKVSMWAMAQPPFQVLGQARSCRYSRRGVALQGGDTPPFSFVAVRSAACSVRGTRWCRSPPPSWPGRASKTQPTQRRVSCSGWRWCVGLLWDVANGRVAI